MIEIISEWVLNIVTVIIFLVFIEITIPSEKFKKYIKFVSGLVVMIIIINPIVATMNEKITLNDITLQAFNELERSDIERNYNNFEQYQNNQIISIYQEKLVSQIKEKILSINGINNADVNINIERDIKNEQFGKLKEINATAYTKANVETQNFGNVKRVSITINDDKENDENKLLNEIKQKLSQIYEIPLDNIKITIH